MIRHKSSERFRLSSSTLLPLLALCEKWRGYHPMNTPFVRSPLLTRDRHLLLTLLLVVALLAALAAMRPLSLSSPATLPHAVDFSNLPLAFVPNAGQTDPVVQFQVHDSTSTVFFTQEEVVVSLPAT